jgi:8-oxo-dGTP diphosphatase
MSVRDLRNPRALPSGHLEESESVIDGAVREAGEEVGVAIDPSDLTFVHVVHYRTRQRGQDRVLLPHREMGRRPLEPGAGKCARLIWSDPAQPPSATVPYTAAALRQITQGQPFSLDGWPSPHPAEA